MCQRWEFQVVLDIGSVGAPIPRTAAKALSVGALTARASRETRRTGPQFQKFELIAPNMGAQSARVEAMGREIEPETPRAEAESPRAAPESPRIGPERPRSGMGSGRGAPENSRMERNMFRAGVEARQPQLYCFASGRITARIRHDIYTYH